MDDKPDDNDELRVAVQRMLQLRELWQQQAEQPPEPSALEYWFDKAIWGIAHALIIDVLFPAGFWWTVLRFCLVRPFLLGRIVNGIINVYFWDEWTADTSLQYVDAWLGVSGYAATHLLYRILYFLFWAGRYLLRCVWLYSLWVSTTCLVLTGLGFLLRVQNISVADLAWRFINYLLSSGSALATLHFRCSVICRKQWASIMGSGSVRMCTLCLRYIILRVLGRQTFDELETFAYSPLASEQREFRLLRLAPQSPVLDIQANLECCSLDAAPPYEAISYLWGKDTRKNHQIILDGKKFFVSDNVYQILCRRGSRFSSRRIWIDSICINQSSDVEKSEQVRMMRDIYHTASHVSICLGESPDAWLAWNMITALAYWRLVLTREGLTNQLFYLMTVKDTDVLVNAQLTAFLNLLDHSWFHRVWVIQEVAVARSVDVLYGNQKLAWSLFLKILDILFNPPIEGIGPLLLHTGQRGLSRPGRSGPSQAVFINVCREKFIKKEPFPLYRALKLFLSFEKTDPRDKIFALLGLTESAVELDHIIDYTKPLPRVLVEVSDAIWEKGQLLEVLHLAGIGWDEARTDIPSWVVDWSVSRGPITLAHSISDDYSQYRAAVQRASEIFYGDDKHIRVRGQLIDCVSKMGSTMRCPNLNEPNLLPESADEMLTWFDEADDLVHKNVAAPYRNGQDLSQVIWRTAIGDRTSDTRPAPAAFEAKIQRFRQLMIQMHSMKNEATRGAAASVKPQSEPNSMSSPFADFDEMKDWLEEVSDIGWLCGDSTFPRKLAITSKGYIAIVPKKTESEDIICTIWGAQVPFVLRPNGSPTKGEDRHYLLVGECYVHGMMDGECFNLPLEDQIFEIV